MKRFLILPLALVLLGCDEKPIASIGGECKLLPVPAYQVKGATTYDQEWADDVTEALVRGCGAHRPKARPPSLGTKAAAKKPPTPVNLHWWQRKIN